MAARSRSATLLLESLESRLVLAQGNLPWPVDMAGLLQRRDLLTTYGQYQEGSVEGLHFHEGVDIVADADTPVRAVEAGKVVTVQSTLTPFYSFISVASETRGWNFIHCVPGINPATNQLWAKDDVFAAGVVLGKVAAAPPGVNFPSHLHLDATDTTIDPYESQLAQPLNVLRPVEDPLYLLKELDKTNPTVSSDVRFRTGATDTSPLPPGAPQQKQSEVEMTSHKYFFERSSGATVVGARTRTRDSANAQGNGSAEIDVIANAYDQFRLAGNHVGVNFIGFRAKGSKYQRADTASVISLRFGEQFTQSVLAPAGHNYGSLRSFNLVRAAYENDATSNSTSRTAFWYTLTNYNGNEKVEARDRDNAWLTDVAVGFENRWYDPTAPKAKGNADSAFPDQFYDLTVFAYDNSGNKDDVTVKVLLDNWEQTVKTDRKEYTTQQVVAISAGENYLRGSFHNVHLIPTNQEPADGAAIGGQHVNEVFADDEGNLEYKELGKKAAGSYVLVVDYDNDSVYNSRLDALTKFSVFDAMTSGDAEFVGHVWADADADGVRDAAEAGVDDVVVYLSQAGQDVAAARTDSSGAYHFTDLGPGSYSLRFDAPSGSLFSPAHQGDPATDSDPDPTTGSTAAFLVGGSDAVTLDAGLVASAETASVAHFVWSDLDSDGVRGVDEPGVAGVLVRLLGPSGSPVSSSTTDADGLYQFAGLAPGSYSLEFVAPSGYSFTAQGAGDEPAYDSDADPLTGLTAPFVLVGGDDAYEFDAGLLGQSVAGGSVAGLAWDDLDGDGVRGTSESGLAGVGVELRDLAGYLVSATTTGADGTYSFADVDPGLFTVRFDVPTGTRPTLRGEGADPDRDSDVGRTEAETALLAVAAGGAVSVDAGFVAGSASVARRAWDDLDGDGFQDANEPAFAGIAVALLDATGSPLDVGTTDASGHYCFAGVPAGSYYVQFDPPAGHSFSPQHAGPAAADSDADPTGLTASFVVAAGDVISGIDAGLRLAPAGATVGDRVWHDADGDGVQGATEPGLSGVVVHLLDAQGNWVATATTDAGGLYRFVGVVAGTYALEFVPPSGMLPTGANVGGDEADSDADPLTHRTQPFVVLGGESYSALDAGFVMASAPPPPPPPPPPPLPLSLSDRVWLDADADGVRDAAESGLANVLVRLLDAQGDLVAGTMSDANGDWHLTGLAAGTYRLEYVAPAGYAFTLRDQGTDDALDSDADPLTGLTDFFSLPGGPFDAPDAGLLPA